MKRGNLNMSFFLFNNSSGIKTIKQTQINKCIQLLDNTTHSKAFEKTAVCIQKPETTDVGQNTCHTSITATPLLAF